MEKQSGYLGQGISLLAQKLGHLRGMEKSIQQTKQETFFLLSQLKANLQQFQQALLRSCENDQLREALGRLSVAEEESRAVCNPLKGIFLDSSLRKNSVIKNQFRQSQMQGRIF